MFTTSYATGSLPRGQKLNNGSLQSRHFSQYPPPSYPASVSQPRRDAKGILPPTDVICDQNVSPVSTGLQGLQGLSGSIGTPGIHRRNVDAPAAHFLPDMYANYGDGDGVDTYDDNSCYYKCPDQWSVYDSSGYRSNSPHAVGIPHHSPPPALGRIVSSSNQGAKIRDADRDNPLLGEECGPPPMSPLAR